MKTFKQVAKEIKKYETANFSVSASKFLLGLKDEFTPINTLKKLSESLGVKCTKKNTADMWDFLADLESCDIIEELKSYNSYNWSGCITNHFVIKQYQSNTGQQFFAIALHRKGDVRANYTDFTLFEFDGFDLLPKIAQCDTAYETFDIKGHDNLSLTVNVMGESMDIYDMENGIDYSISWTDDINEIIQAINEQQ